MNPVKAIDDLARAVSFPFTGRQRRAQRQASAAVAANDHP
jgi:hypothetical protein